LIAGATDNETNPLSPEPLLVGTTCSRDGVAWLSKPTVMRDGTDLVRSDAAWRCN
jgi:hypothetical protein